MAECQPCLPAMDTLGYRTLSPGPRTSGLEVYMPEALSRPGPLGGQKTPEGQLDAWGWTQCTGLGPGTPEQIVLACAHPLLLAPGTDGAWEVDGEDTEFPGRTQGSQRNHRRPEPHWRSLPPGGVRPCSLHCVSGAGSLACLPGPTPALPLLILSCCGHSGQRPWCPANIYVYLAVLGLTSWHVRSLVVARGS